ncbi:hypothetical protein CBL_03260 [Carabus blaptoides fortunei]
MRPGRGVAQCKVSARRLASCRRPYTATGAAAAALVTGRPGPVVREAQDLSLSLQAGESVSTFPFYKLLMIRPLSVSLLYPSHFHRSGTAVAAVFIRPPARTSWRCAFIFQGRRHGRLARNTPPTLAILSPCPPVPDRILTRAFLDPESKSCLSRVSLVDDVAVVLRGLQRKWYRQSTLFYKSVKVSFHNHELEQMTFTLEKKCFRLRNEYWSCEGRGCTAYTPRSPAAAACCRMQYKLAPSFVPDLATASSMAPFEVTPPPAIPLCLRHSESGSLGYDVSCSLSSLATAPPDRNLPSRT